MTNRASVPVVLGLGSNLGDRRRNLRRAVGELGAIVRVVRISSLYDTDPVGSPAGAPSFLNIVIVGVSALPADVLLQRIHAIEAMMGRRRSVPNAPRTIDIDIVLYGAVLRRSVAPLVPHPRYTSREFVLAPLRELGLPWVDPVSGVSLAGLRGNGEARRAGPLY